MKDLELLSLEKPSRYINHELNAAHKDPSSVRVKVCLAFPDVYEIGISHLGLKILYSVINQLDYALADRAYLPWIDALNQMKEKKISLWGWESKLPLKSFDLIGITLQSELTYTNVLELLEISRIPIHANERTNFDPIVIAGGPCAVNPLPMARFIDAFLIGEGEEAIEEIVSTIDKEKYLIAAKREIPADRKSILKQLSKIKGMYVPCVHDSERKSNPSFRIDIRKYNDFHSNKKVHTPQLLPWQLATHNRYLAEIMRGCTRGCRFCQAGYFYRPVRERNPEDILQTLLKEINEFGWEEAGLLSLSTTDYTCIKPLLEALLTTVNQDKTHISLPSLRADALDDKLVLLMKHIGREGLTIAPEAGSQRLRQVINKNLNETDILDSVRIAKNLGWQKIKLYFMVGLPTETDQDIDAIIDLIHLIKSETGRRFQINVSISPFVPKTHTPFQWFAMIKPQLLLQRVLKIRHAFAKYPFINIKYHEIETSILEAILSRGDEQTSLLIENAWREGALFDGWMDVFKPSYWLKAAKTNIFEEHDIFKEISLDITLPWSFINLGIHYDFLIKERQKALAEEITKDCRVDCVNCGLCKDELQMRLVGSQTKGTITLPQNIRFSKKENSQLRNRQTHQSWKYRLVYAKTGDFRFISHLDWMRMFYRLLARSKLDIVYPQEFNPHPKVSFCPPLALGISGLREFADMHTWIQYSEMEIFEVLNGLFKENIQLNEVQSLPSQISHVLPKAEELEIVLPKSFCCSASQIMETFFLQSTFLLDVMRKDKVTRYDLKDVIISYELKDNILRIIKSLNSPNPYIILAHLFKIEKQIIYLWEIYRKRFIF